jgi:hypothetical protein
MIVVYRKNTGEIIMSVPESFSTPPLISEGKYKSTGNSQKDIELIKKLKPKKVDTDYIYLMPLEAYDFEDPKNAKNIHEYKVVFNSNQKPLYLQHPKTKDKVQHINKEDIKETMLLWDDTYRVLKGLHPKLKIKESLQKEGMKLK